jgi:hypothetical protein
MAKNEEQTRRLRPPVFVYELKFGVGVGTSQALVILITD